LNVSGERVDSTGTIGWLAAGWRAPPGVHAGTSTRSGGASVGSFASFNLAAHVGDTPAAVAANRARLRTELALPAEPLWLRQVHGTHVVVHDGAVNEPEADAAVAFEPGRVLAVLTADCLPVVLASGDGRCIGVAHAGWRGLAAGVLERVVEALADAGGGVLAWLGPAIGPTAFEVGAEVREALLAGDAGAAAAFAPNARGRWQADLEALARRRLARLGVAVTGSGACTFADRERFYSFRRENRCGRMATLAWIEARDAMGAR
jgi:YfiH family protein